VERDRNRYHCLLFKPVWLVETARGCPFRCSFCSVWQLYDRSFRERSIGAVVDDMASVGEHVFVADDLFWNHPERSLELAQALRKRGVKKRWLLVQTRTDLVCRRPDLLEAWRPLAKDFDIFFGLEAASDEGLAGIVKDTGVWATIEAARISRSYGYGVTGNFLVDPDWNEGRFHELWDFVARHGLERAGYTILTPLPGTNLYERLRPILADQPWFKYDMHHLLWEPRLGARRFFELYAETWRRSILNTAGEKKLVDWMRQMRPSQIPYITRVVLRTQRIMRAEAYLKEHEATQCVRQEIPAEAAQAT
jgi:pyruvate-formate lyase-activating enzyme